MSRWKLRGDLVALTLLLAAIAVGFGFGIRLSGGRHFPGAPGTFGEWPVLGQWAPHLGPGTPLAIMVAIAVVAWGPDLAVRLPWRRALLLAYFASVGWILSLALIDGWQRGVAGQLASQDEYLSAVGGITDIGVMLRTFSSRILDFQPDSWTTHVSGHPPGATLIFVWLDRLGLGGGGWAGIVCILVGALTAVAVPFTVSTLGNPSLARATLPFMALFPGAVWIGVSADGLFAGVTATGIALLALRRWWSALAGGLLLGFGAFLSYGLALLGVLALAVLLLPQRRFGCARRTQSAVGGTLRGSSTAQGRPPAPDHQPSAAHRQSPPDDHARCGYPPVVDNSTDVDLQRPELSDPTDTLDSGGRRLTLFSFGRRSALLGFGRRSALFGFGRRLALLGFGRRLALLGFGRRLALLGFGRRLALFGFGRRSALFGFGRRPACGQVSGPTADNSPGRWEPSQVNPGYLQSRTLSLLVLALFAAGAVVALFAWAGFWWFDGYDLVVQRYYQGIANDRPYWYWIWANLACLTLVLGPAVAAGLPKAWRYPLVAAAIVMVLLADLSGLSKSEVERIWLPFVVWLVPAAGFLPGSARRWLAAQAVIALMVNHLLLTNW